MVGPCRQCERYQEQLASLQSKLEILKVTNQSTVGNLDLLKINSTLEEHLLVEKKKNSTLDESLKTTMGQLEQLIELKNTLLKQVEEEITKRDCGTTATHGDEHDLMEENANLKDQILKLRGETESMRITVAQQKTLFDSKLDQATMDAELQANIILGLKNDFSTSTSQLKDSVTELSQKTITEDKLRKAITEKEKDFDQLQMTLVEQVKKNQSLERNLQQVRDEAARKEVENRLDQLSRDDQSQKPISKPMSIPLKRS